MHACMLIHFSCIWLFVTPWTVAHQAPLSMGLSRQVYWSGSPFPSPGHLPDWGIEPGSPALQSDSLPSEPPGKLLRAKRTDHGQEKKWRGSLWAQWVSYNPQNLVTVLEGMGDYVAKGSERWGSILEKLREWCYRPVWLRKWDEYYSL